MTIHSYDELRGAEHIDSRDLIDTAEALSLSIELTADESALLLAIGDLERLGVVLRPMTVAQIFRARVALHLQNGRSHAEALRLAQLPVLGERQQPQSPVHSNLIRPCDCGRHIFPPCPHAVAAGLAATGIAATEMVS